MNVMNATVFRGAPWRLALGSSVLLAAMMLSTAAHAQGYFWGSTGARASGRAGAFTAKADDLAAVEFNPAGLAKLDGTLLHVGNRFSYNAHSFTRAPTLDFGNLQAGAAPLVEFSTVENQQPWQLLEPLLGVASNLGLDDFGFALAIYAPAGAGRKEFPVDGGQRYMMVRRDVQVLAYSASAAWSPSPKFGVGATFQWIHVPKLHYELVVDGVPFPGDANPVSSEFDMLARVEGSDPMTLNAILGAWYRPARFLEIGLSGQVIPTAIQTDSTLTIDPLSTGIQGGVELTRDGRPADDVTLTLPLPLTARVGVRYIHEAQGTELFDVELDVNYESWSRVETFTLDTDGLSATLLGQTLDVGRIDIQKQWQDTLSFHLGGDYALVPDLAALRAGVFYATPVAEPRHAHVDFVSGPQLGGALGGSVFLGSFEVALAYTFRYQPKVEVSEDDASVFQEAPASQCEPPYTDPNTCHPEYLGQPAPAVNAGSYRAHAHALSLDVLHRF